jgi:putative ABC transport system permease protein
MPHVVSVAPVVLERYQVQFGERETTATATIGIDVEKRRMEERLVAGRYLAGPRADEVLLHEYLAYRWGFVTEEQTRSLLGETVRLRQIRSGTGPFGASPEMIAELVERLDLSTLTAEEREALPTIVEKLGRSMASPAGEDADATERTMTIVGVVRDREAGEPFRVIEDGNAWQVDLFLPRETAIEMFLSSPVNREIGFTRALVTVDDARNAKAVETELRERGYTAYSVATVLERIERSLGVLTLVVSFLTGIALIVAALGIVNTMVTSVLERTAEIGLWKAVGATDGQVRRVFVLEAAILGLVGGLLGLGVAALLTVPGEALATRILAQRSAVPVEAGLFRIPVWLALGGPLLATCVAVLASLYPAARAARVDPVRALRHD